MWFAAMTVMDEIVASHALGQVEVELEALADGLAEVGARLRRVQAAFDLLAGRGWERRFTRAGNEDTPGEELYFEAAEVGFYEKTLPLVFVAIDILAEEQPMTLRGLFYRIVCARWLPSTDRQHYDRLCRIMVKLREAEVIPSAWLVDHVRSTIKPSSWSGLADYAETCRESYRKNFWA